MTIKVKTPTTEIDYSISYQLMLDMLAHDFHSYISQTKTGICSPFCPDCLKILCPTVFLLTHGAHFNQRNT